MGTESDPYDFQAAETDVWFLRDAARERLIDEESATVFGKRAEQYFKLRDIITHSGLYFVRPTDSVGMFDAAQRAFSRQAAVPAMPVMSADNCRSTISVRPARRDSQAP